MSGKCYLLVISYFSDNTRSYSFTLTFLSDPNCYPWGCVSIRIRKRPISTKPIRDTQVSTWLHGGKEDLRGSIKTERRKIVQTILEKLKITFWLLSECNRLKMSKSSMKTVYWKISSKTRKLHWASYVRLAKSNPRNENALIVKLDWKKTGKRRCWKYEALKVSKLPNDISISTGEPDIFNPNRYASISTLLCLIVGGRLLRRGVAVGNFWSFFEMEWS